MENLRAHMRELGFDVPSDKFILDGSLKRFPRNGSKDSAWFIGWLHNYVKRPGTYCIAEFGDWRTNEKFTYLPTDIGGAEKKLAEGVIKQAQKKLEVERRALQAQAILTVKEKLARASKVGSSPYLNRKKIELCGALLLGENLMIPMQGVDGEIVGAQYIAPDGQKWFEKGQRVDGGFFRIGGSEGATFLCEGYATGASIHMATNQSVIVAFNAANLPKVARLIRESDPEVRLTICADDDQFTEINGKPKNTGRENAEKAGAVSMAAVVYPSFVSNEGKPTDFNDLHCREGLEAVRKLLIVVKEPEMGFRSLGYDDGGHYFFNIEAKDIFRLSAMTPEKLFLLAPESYWIQNYTPPESIKTNYRRAANDLINVSLKKGRFDPQLVRGLGVWLDQERVVVNTGEKLLVNGTQRGLYWPDGQSIYVQTAHKMPKIRQPATVDECRALLDVCHMLNWLDSNSAFYLPGWLAVARIAGALPIRPHIWLTGGSATGKSTVLKEIVENALGGIHAIMMVQGGTTEAGIRQTLRASSIPLIFDEFESVTKSTKERHESIIELLRNTWSSTSGQVVKGSAGGTSSAFNMAFSSLVSSIGVNLLTDADRSRFSILELAPHGDNNGQYKRLSEAMRKVTPELGHRIFARMVSLLPVLLESFQILREEIAVVSRQRMGQQVGMLMSGWWILQSDEVITRDQAASIAHDLNLREVNAERQTEEMACLNHLMTTVVRLDETMTGATKSIWSIISAESEIDKRSIEELKKYGIVVEENAIFVASEHAFLERLFAQTKWHNWSSFLTRLPGAEKVPKKRFGPGHRCRTTKIPLNLIQKD